MIKKYRHYNKQYHIDVVILGTGNTGKSTFINALFVEQYSEINKKENIINESNINYDDIIETDHIVDKDYYSDLINLHNECELVIHEYPRLDNNTDLYYKYITNEFIRYDIVIFIIDIYKSFNNEIDNLKLILNLMKQNKIEYNRDCKLIILLNKCDNLEKNILLNEYLPSETELLETVQQIKTIVNTHKKEIYDNAPIDILCISCRKSFVYRTLTKNNEICTLNTFLENGFSKFIELFNEYLSLEKQYLIIYNCICLSLDNRKNDLDTIKYHEICILDLQQKFNKKNDLSKIENTLNNFIDYYTKKYCLLVNKYKITNEYQYNKSIHLKDIFNNIIKLFNTDNYKLIKDTIKIITKNINNYIRDRLINNLPTSTFINQLKLLESNNYDNDKLLNLIFICFSILSSNNNILTNDLSKNEHFLVSNLIDIDDEFIISYHVLVNLIYNTLINYNNYAYEKYVKSLEDNDEVYQHLYINYISYKTSYLSSIHIKTTNKYSKNFNIYKNMIINITSKLTCNTLINNVSEISDNDNILENIEEMNFLDKYFVHFLKHKYNDDIILIDDINIKVKPIKKDFSTYLFNGMIIYCLIYYLINY